MWRERLLGTGGPNWTPQERALLSAFLDWPSVALPIHVLIDAVWVGRGEEPPLTTDAIIRLYVSRVRRKLRDMGLNPAALVSEPPLAYGLNLDALGAPPVRKLRQIITMQME